jgi:dihydrofolate synthase/folylpolyglutamate synthase
MRFNHLDDWLVWQETLNPAEIDLGLERVAHVLGQAGLSTSFKCPLITVAGTNGKGSVVAMLEAIAMAAGLKVCSYTSPHIFHYNERIKINAQPVDNTALCAAFDRIDQARGDSELTYFEFGTLAAIDLFSREQADLVILEVGLGGRLDAVNIMQADVSVLTTVAIDHVDWLGDNRESIGYEKAGIFRANKPVICGERIAPESVKTTAKELQCDFIQAGRDYDVVNHKLTDERNTDHWTLKSCYRDIVDLPLPVLQGEFQKLNAATAIMALQALQINGLLLAKIDFQKTAEFRQTIILGLSRISLSGRFQQIVDQPEVYVDVAHNLQAAQSLASQLILTQHENLGKTWAIVAMLADKDIRGVLQSLSTEIDFWCFSGLENISRGLSAQQFIEKVPGSILAETNIETAQNSLHDLSVNQCKILSDTVLLAKTVKTACETVLSKVKKNDRIIIFGSFYTVAEAMLYFSEIKSDVSNKNIAELIN